MKKLLLIFTMLVLLQVVKAQKQPINANRPGISESAGLVIPGALQIESGFNMKSHKETNLVLRNYSYNNSTFRLGLIENFEFRVGTSFLGESFTYQAEDSVIRYKGFGPISLGGMVKICEEQKLRPEINLVGYLGLKSGSKNFRPSYTSSSFYFIFKNTLSEKFALTYNLGAIWDGESPEATFAYTLCLDYAITKRFASFCEAYVYLPESGTPAYNFDGGFYFYISKVVLWDISAGICLTESAPDSFIDTGISFRLFK